MEHQQTTVPTSSGSNTVIVAFIAFIGLGITSGLLGIAWPYIQHQFELPLDGVGTLFLGSTVAYTIAGFSIGRLITRFGSGRVFLTGAILLALAMFGTGAAPVWGAVIAFAVLSGFGAGFVDAGLNMYLATYHTARQMSWLHASFGVGITIGPIIMAFALTQALGWRLGYTIAGILVLVIVGLMFITRKQWRTEGLQTTENKPVSKSNFAATLRIPAVWFSMLTYLAYVSVEIGVGQWTYVLLTQARGIDPKLAQAWVSLYWGVFTVGRIFFGFISSRFAVGKLLRVCMLGMIVGAALFWLNPLPFLGFVGLVILTFSQAPVFPLLMSTTAQRVGVEHTENTISLQMGAVGIGTAILPGLIGTIGQYFGLQTMFVVFAGMTVVVFIFHELTRIRLVSAPVPSSSGD